MVRSFLTVCLASGLVASLLVRVIPEVKSGPLKSSAEEQRATGKRNSFRWLNRTRVSVSRESFKRTGGSLAVGEIRALKQTVSGHWNCVFGVFRVTKVSENVVLLDAISRASSSRMQLWAEAQGLTPEWSWEPVSAGKSSNHFLQQCSSWISDGSKRQIFMHTVHGEKFFIRGSRYSEAQVVTPAGVALEVDHMKRGWWIRALKGQQQVVLLLRNANTGLPEELTLNFSSNRLAKSVHGKSSKKIELRKPFALPGWD